MATDLFGGVKKFGEGVISQSEVATDWLEERIGTSVNLNRRDGPVIEFTGPSEGTQSSWDDFLKRIGLKKDKKEADTSTPGIDNLINALEEENKKTARAKADLASRALLETQARLARERKPGMDTKNRTILTSPLGIPASQLTEPKKQTLLGA